MKVIPQQSRIVVEVVEESHGSIALPDTAIKDEDGNVIEPPLRFRVVEVGPGRTLDNGAVVDIPLKPGDEVVFDPRYSGKLEPTYFYGGRKLVVVDYAGVVAKIERAPGEPTFTFPKPKVVAAKKLLV